VICFTLDFDRESPSPGDNDAINEMLLREFDQEMSKTKTTLERVVVTAKPLKVDKEADLVGLFTKMSGEARQALAGLSDEQFNQTWALKRNGQTIIAMPRYDMLRGICLNHIIHHRGQLTMYSRELNVPVPRLDGPSADENPFG
jgi:hypothetical protein